MRRAARTGSQPQPLPTARRGSTISDITDFLSLDVCVADREYVYSPQKTIALTGLFVPITRTTILKTILFVRLVYNCANLATRARLRWRITAYRVRAGASGDRQPTAHVALRRHFPLGFAEYQGRINELQNPTKNNVLSKSKFLSYFQ